MDILEINDADRQGTAAEDILRALSSNFRGMIDEPAEDRISKAWNGIDVKTKAWVDEMVTIYEDATFEQFKDKTRQLSEIRVAYNIQIRERLLPSIVRQIKEKLLLVDHRLAIPILGMRDAHKQALRDLINDDNSIRHHFRYRVWVRVPEEFTAASISNQILEFASSSSSENPSVQDILTRNTCLVVLDEIRTVEIWHSLDRVFQKATSSSGSRIILITNKDACSSFDDTFHLPINLTSKELLPKSRENVPSYLRQCIYYFLLFPVNFQIPTRRLIALWVAEGLVHDFGKNGNESVENVAERYLNELIDLGLVLITKKKLNGKVKACQLNDNGGTRDTWLAKAREARFFQDANDCTTRLVDNHDTNDDSSFIQVHMHVPNFSPDYRNVISLLSFNTQEGNKPGEDVGYFLNKCILAGFFLWLRVLDLERVFRPKLPKSITKLTLLRYLGLRWTYLEDLPEFVSMLLNLQVLDMKHTYITVLPKSIWRMQYLRHLYLSETYRTRFGDPPPDHHIRANDLQTLWGAFIDGNSSAKRGLFYLRKLRKLGLSCRSMSSTQLQDVARWISTLKFLETLRLKSRDERGRACDLHLESLERNFNLSTVYLLGKLINPLVVATFPKNLIEVTLSGSDLKGNDDPMECLGKLKELIVLRLLSGSVMLSELRCSRGSFPKLKAFMIWELPNLKEWEAEEGVMPCLEDLEIRRCKSLKMVPRALEHVDTLKKFRMTRMPQSFITDSEKERPLAWSKVEKVLQVIEQQSS